MWRKIQALGLSQVYRQEGEIRQLLKELMALPFLPSDQIVPSFNELRQCNNTDRLNEVEYSDSYGNLLKQITWEATCTC